MRRSADERVGLPAGRVQRRELVRRPPGGGGTRRGPAVLTARAAYLTYGELKELVDRTGHALRDLGVDMEHRVVMVCLDAPEFLGAFWGAIKIGAVPVPVNTSFAPPTTATSSRTAGRGSRSSRQPFSPRSRPRSRAHASPARAGRRRPAGGHLSFEAGSRARQRPSRRLRPRATTSPSGSTPRARPAARRAPSTYSTTWWSPPRPTRSRSSACGRPTGSTRRPSSSSRTASGTPATSR